MLLLSVLQGLSSLISYLLIAILKILSDTLFLQIGVNQRFFCGWITGIPPSARGRKPFPRSGLNPTRSKQTKRVTAGVKAPDFAGLKSSATGDGAGWGHDLSFMR